MIATKAKLFSWVRGRRSPALLSSISGVIRQVPLLLAAFGFALWMVKPVGDPYLMVAGYGCVSTSAMLNGIFQGFWANRRMLLFFGISVAVGLIGVLHGTLVENPGVGYELIFFVALPLVWFAILAGFDVALVRGIVNAIPFVSLAIGLLGVSYWLDATGKLSLDWVTLVDLGQGIGDQGYGYGLTFYPISSLVFLLPFLFVSLIVQETYSWRVSRIVAWPALAFVLCLLFVSGRRALFASLGISIIVGFVLLFLGKGEAQTRRRMYWVAAGVSVAGVAIAIASKFSLNAMYESLIIDIFAADSVRAQSIQALTGSWLRSPLFGHGLGALVNGSIRSVDRPWNFEVQYQMMLNALGVVGFGALAVITVWLLVIAVRLYRTGGHEYPFLAAVIVGAISLLVANATNPYMHTPGHYWMFFFLVVATNALLREQAGVTRSLALWKRGQVDDRVQS